MPWARVVLKYLLPMNKVWSVGGITVEKPENTAWASRSVLASWLTGHVDRMWPWYDVWEWHFFFLVFLLKTCDASHIVTERRGLSACYSKTNKETRWKGKFALFQMPILGWRRGEGGRTSVQRPPSSFDNQWIWAFIVWWRGLYAETA